MNQFSISKKTAAGLSVLLAAFVCSLVVLVIAQFLIPKDADYQTMMQGNMMVLSLVVSCLGLLTGLLQLVGLILLVTDAGKVGGLHKIFSWAGLALYVLCLAPIILSAVVGMELGTTGSLDAARTTYYMAIVSTIMGTIALILSAFGIANLLQRGLLALYGLLSVGGGVVSSLMALNNLKIEAMTISGITTYVPVPSMDMSSLPYLLANYAAMGGTAIGALAFLLLTIEAWKAMRSREVFTDTVV